MPAPQFFRAGIATRRADKKDGDDLAIVSVDARGGKSWLQRESNPYFSLERAAS
jgi:hypothetical protein